MKVGVIGLGLIGGSIFKRLKAQGYDIVAVSSTQTGENIFSDYSALKDCNFIFICTPIHTILDVLDKLTEVIPADTIVTDTASLKEFVTKKSYSFKFIPSHPMAGTEFSGYKNSFPELFDGAKWVITPYDNTDTSPLEKLIKDMGAVPVYASPKAHDKAAAMISHTPMLIAQALFVASFDDDLALKLAASGFRDMTRLAVSNPEMAADMINFNYYNIEQSLLKIYSVIGDLLKNYDKDFLTEIALKRKNMYDKNGKNIL